MRPSGDSASQARGLRVHPLLLLKSLAPPPPIGAHLTFASLSCVSLKSDNRPISVHQASGHAILTNVYHPSSERDERLTNRSQTLPMLFCEVFTTNNVTPPGVACPTHAFVGKTQPPHRPSSYINGHFRRLGNAGRLNFHGVFNHVPHITIRLGTSEPQIIHHGDLTTRAIAPGSCFTWEGQPKT
ncbi:uncharacterized protein K489DRAFT_368044 [Dissoconium aciculare CBS 342.82]|uniref:Uncharacterized protein n=1 Tax=Dissoconium aciculare CBS 342.82 TaxID=1314786 RepID=A0A6J3MD87_9PEZI|nr:uncharacterized protein K489DRAFT_368044 [Dissoconium aciculare CBS 342.82]KAF1824807.1 hypothetical protein K489DRAFT_368044 [Dissoconium aciculare CBS 342.82]